MLRTYRPCLCRAFPANGANQHSTGGQVLPPHKVAAATARQLEYNPPPRLHGNGVLERPWAV
eukprot:1675064-Pyramimonas_sp.AAC.1